MLTKEEKTYYNIYLAISRSSRNKAFQLRKDFENFEDSLNAQYLKKISMFFFKFPQIKPEIYFKAPYELFPDEDWFDLKFFVSPKAIHCYTMYYRRLQEMSPDTDDNIDFIKKSLKFIAMFCIHNKIQLSEYVTYEIGTTKCWMKHLKEHNISLYSLFEFDNIYDVISDTPKDELYLFLDGIIDRIDFYKNKYNESKIAKEILKKGVKTIDIFIRKNIENDKKV